jgi:hypothetical protein
VLDGRIHLAGGRMDTFDFNTGMHVAYDPITDGWKAYAQMTAPRHGMGAAIVGDAIHFTYRRRTERSDRTSREGLEHYPGILTDDATAVAQYGGRDFLQLSVSDVF